MENEPRLVPRKVTIEGHLKVWGGTRDQGSTDGSTFAVEYDVPDGIDKKGFRKLCLEQKEFLDQMALVAERLKDSISQVWYKQRLATMRSSYDIALGRKREDGPIEQRPSEGPGPNPEGGSGPGDEHESVSLE